MEFLETLSENWIEILSAIGTIVAIFFGTKRKKSAEEIKAAKEAKQKKKSQAATAKLMKAEAAQKKALEKAQEEAAKLYLITNDIQGGKS